MKTVVQVFSRHSARNPASGKRISQDQYELFVRLKDIRNGIMHRAKLAKKSDTACCIKQSQEVLRQKCGVDPSDEVCLMPTA